MRSISVILTIIFLIMTSSGCICRNSPGDTVEVPVSAEFGDPVKVAIIGYDGDAMEPFLTRDGSLLLFNNRNDPAVNTDLHYAERINDTAFLYIGELKGANTDALEGVASMDSEYILYFTSTRSYATTLSTIYSGQFDSGRTTDIAIVEGISPEKAPWLNMDSEISADGQRLYYTVNEFDMIRGLPKTSDIVIAEKHGSQFLPLDGSERIMKNINTGQLEYAPCTSADELTLYFTRADLSRGMFSILVAKRNSTSEQFGTPQKIGAVDGSYTYTEGPTLSPDGKKLYYHAFDAGKYRIFMVQRVG